MALKEVEPTIEALRVSLGQSVRFDDSGITNLYANVSNVSSSREEVVLVFGINNT